MTTVPDHEAEEAGWDYRRTLVARADDPDRLLWHGWAIMEAFLAGVTWEQKRHVTAS